MAKMAEGGSTWEHVTGKGLDEDMLECLRALAQAADEIGFVSRDRCYEIVRASRSRSRTARSYPGRMLDPFVRHHLMIRLSDGVVVEGYMFTTEGRRLAGLKDIVLDHPMYEAALANHLRRCLAELDLLGLHCSSLLQATNAPVELRLALFDAGGKVRRWIRAQIKSHEKKK